MQRGASTTLSELPTELIINRTQYSNAERPNEYYVINDDEDLFIYDVRFTIYTRQMQNNYKAVDR